MFVTKSGGVKSLSRNLADEFDEVGGPKPAQHDFSDDSKASSQFTSKKDGHRPPINGDTPVANKTIGQCLKAMQETSKWIQVFAPKPARQAVWSELMEELSYPVNSTSTEQATADTVSLLTAMGMATHAYPSKIALADWSPTEVGSELQKWKKKLNTAFGSQGVGMGDNRWPELLVNPANVPLPQTPKKVTKNVFASGEQSPYFQDSHMITPRSANRQRRLTTELAQQTRELTEMGVLNSTPRIELLQHRPLTQITPFRDLERQLTPMQLKDIYTLEDVVSDILTVENDNRNRTHDRRHSEPRSTRVALADATLSDLISELQVRTPQEDVNEYSEEIPACTDETIGYEQNESDPEYFSQEEVQIDDPYAAQDEGVVAAANDNERRAAANGTFARSDKRPQQSGTPPSEFNQGGYRSTAGQGMRFGDNRGGRGFSKPQYGPCASCGGLNHSTHYCFRRCKLCQQVHDAGQWEAFNELAKFLRTKVDKNDISPELQKFVFGCLPTETGLDLIRQPQSAERVIDADCIYAFISRCNYPGDDNDYCMNTTGFEKERGISLDGGELDLETEVKITQDGDEYRWENVAETGSMVSVHAKMVKLLPGERMGWWKSKRFDQRVRMRAIVRGAVNDLATGANVSIISPRLAKRLRLQQISGHGRQLEVQVAEKITLGWNTVYEFDFWVMEHSAGSEVILGTDFMIPAGMRLDLFHPTSKLPDEVMIPLIKTQNFDDDIPEGMHVPGGPNDNLQIAAGEWADFRLQRNKPSLGTHNGFAELQLSFQLLLNSRKGNQHGFD
ncbi:LOW QUALITY PROTEIN: hypothetical protein PHMEG_00029004 [Phytophthora megakarya]|uniref:Eukaryotic/viral aspartic protease n=1 Tax=Phytophthora megakarya TaxID=4795 RepID=A0A225V4A6_9STRA|nr:LOW QUALITY PROTEIN: hypothetical protein PHMEG_00029004 [Phytophthora megakarya]